MLAHRHERCRPKLSQPDGRTLIRSSLRTSRLCWIRAPHRITNCAIICPVIAIDTFGFMYAAWGIGLVESFTAI